MSHEGKVVCGGCFSEEALSAYIDRRGESGDCDYCGQSNVKVLEMEGVVAHIEKCLRTEYSTAEEEGLLWDDEEQRYFPEAFDIHEVFNREFGVLPETIASCGEISYARSLTRLGVRKTLQS